MALPIYTHIPNLKVLTKIFFKLSRPKGNLCGRGGVTVLNPKYPRLLSGDTIISNFKSSYPRLTLKEGLKVNVTSEDSQSMISYHMPTL